MWGKFLRRSHSHPRPPDVNTEYEVSESLRAADSTPRRQGPVYPLAFDYYLHTHTKTHSADKKGMISDLFYHRGELHDGPLFNNLPQDRNYATEN